MRPASRPASWPGMFGTALLSVQDANRAFHANGQRHISCATECTSQSRHGTVRRHGTAREAPQRAQSHRSATTRGTWRTVILGLVYLSCLPYNDQSHPVGCPCSFWTSYLPGPPSWPPIPRRMAAITPVRPILPARMPARGSGAGSSRFQKACCSCASIVSSHTASSMYA